jgi:uncharacterized delta-60 repeat protein
LPRKASAGVTVSITRTGGFSGPVTVNASGLPSGVTAAPLTIPAGSSSGILNLSATASATLSTAPVVMGINGSSTGVTAQSTNVNLTVRPGGGERANFASSISGYLDGGLSRSVSTGDGDGVTSMLVQPDGKIVLGGSTTRAGGGNVGVVMRLNADGSKDATFGTDGTLRLETGTYHYVTALVLQANGKIIVASRVDGVAVLARIKINGVLDDSFGDPATPGVIAPAGIESFDDMSVLSDGRILAVGSRDNDMLLASFTSSGSPDISFDTDGYVSRDLTLPGTGGTSTDVATELEVLSDGKILIAGYGVDRVVVAKYAANGTPDASFGTAGLVSTNIGTQSRSVDAMQVQTDGKIVVMGTKTDEATSSDPVTYVLRFTANGASDTAFATAGQLLINISLGGSDFPGAILPQADGKLVLVSSVLNASDTFAETSVMRLLPNGSFDPSFGTDGKLQTVPTGMNGSFASSGLLLADDKLLIGTTLTFGAETNFGLIRLWL